jgi:hypothetical protein
LVLYNIYFLFALVVKILIMRPNEKWYMLPIGDPAIEANRELFTKMEAAETHTLRFKVTLDDVKAGRCGEIQRVMMALQHYPHLIEKMLFCLEFDFVEDYETEIAVPEEAWKGDPMFFHWFQTMMGTPFMLFFIADEDARFYSLMGDMITSGEMEVSEVGNDGRAAFTPDLKQTETLNNRVFFSCLNLLQFCHGSGFDPRIYIESVMAWLSVQFTYDQVLQEFEYMWRNTRFRVIEKEV